jgi:L-threonylcarbamoyladenylate synthase
MTVNTRIRLALHHLKKGVIAHPTDTIYGLGCLANNSFGIRKIIELKKRDISKGFILLASDIGYLLPYIDCQISEDLLEQLSLPTKSPTTFLVPKSEELPPLLAGGNELLAVRITSNPLIKFFCEETESALISTSANLQGKKAASTQRELKSYFGNQLDYVLPPSGYNSEPSKIINLMTGERLR